MHFHTVGFDGTFHEQPDGCLQFVPVGVPKQADVERVLAQVYRAVLRMLRKRGLLEADESDDRLRGDTPNLAACYEGAVTQRLALGPERGRPVVRLGGTWKQAMDGAESRTKRAGLLCADLDGFSLHANVALAAEQRDRLERLLRYCARPPLANERLQLRDDGRYQLELKSPWRDGTTHLRFDPLELLEKLAAQIPRPRINLVLYSGMLAPRARHRNQAVAYGRPPPRAAQTDEPNPKPTRAHGERWAELMQHAFALDVLQCPHCPGRLVYIATIRSAQVAQAILRSLGRDTERPSPASPRDPPPFWSALHGDVDHVA